MSDNLPENIKDKARAILSEKAATTSGVIEKSIIGGVLAFLVDFVTPYLNLVVYLSPFLFILMISCFFIWRRKRTHLLRTGLVFSFVAFSLSSTMLIYQQYVPVSKQKGIMATNIKGIEEVQSSLGLIDERLSKIELGVEKIAETSVAIGKNTLATVDALTSMKESLVTLTSNGGLISSPKTQAEIFHNARIYSQRGEIDNAVKFYKQFFKASKVTFIDAVTDYADLQKRLLGIRGAVQAIRIDTELSEQTKTIAKVYLQDSIDLLAAQIMADSELDLPFYIIYIQTLYEKFMPSRLPKSKTLEVPENQLTHLQYSSFLVAHEHLKKHIEDGSYRTYFLDNIKASKIENIYDAVKSSMYEERKYIADFPVAIQYRTRDMRIFFRDFIDITKPAKVCGQIITKLDKRLGISYDRLSEDERAQLRKLLHMSTDPSKIGVRVTKVTPDGPAMKAGILEGDILFSYRNNLVIENTWEFRSLLQSTAVGKLVPIEIIRAGARIKSDIQIQNGHIRGEDKCFDYFDKTSWLIEPEKDTPDRWFILDKTGWLQQVPIETAFHLSDSNGMFCVQSVSYTDKNGMLRNIKHFDIWLSFARSVKLWDKIDDIDTINHGSIREIESCINYAAEDGKRKTP